MMTKQNRILLLFLLLLVGTRPVIAADYLLNISANDKGKVQVYKLNGVELSNQGSVAAGEKYRVVATCEDANYLFDHIEVAGGRQIVVEDKEKGISTFIVSGSGSVTVKAVFVGKPQTIELKAPEAGQGTYSVICNGKRIQDKGTVPYGSAITVIAEPKEGYCLVGIEGNNEEFKCDNNQYTIESVINKVSISVTFKEIKPVITFKAGLLTSLEVYAGKDLIKSGQTVPYGTKLMVTAYSKNGRVYLLRINNEFPNLKQEDMNKFCCFVDAIGDIHIDMPKVEAKSDSRVYADSKDLMFEYDGKAKPFQNYRRIPYKPDGMIVMYKGEKDNSFSVNEPIEVGEYDVEITTNEEKYIKATASNTKLKAKLTITKAPVFIHSLPSVLFENNKPVLKGGLAVANGKPVQGSFDFVTSPTEAGLTTIIFTPKDISHYKTAQCMLPFVYKEDIERYRMNIASLPSGLSLQIMNGDAIVQNGDMVAKGTKLKLNVIGLSDDKEVKQYINQLSVTNYETIDEFFFVEKAYNLSAVLKEKEPLPVFSLKNEANKTEGYKDVYLPFKTLNIGTVSLDNYRWIITYTNKATNEKVIAPMNVGEYKMDLYYPSDGKYASFRGEGTFTITEGDPNAVFTNIQVSSVAEGQPLSFSSITGGVADVPGTFTWKDSSLKVYNGKEYEIVFTPTDPNYKKMSAKVPVPITTVPFLSFAPKNGTIRVVNKTTNQTLKSGDWLSVGDELVINAQPFSGYTLQGLSVNSYSISNGSSYFVGDKPLAIEAAFEGSSDPSVSYYTVTIPEVTGAIVLNAGANSVKAGSSFSFVIDYDLLYGAPTVTAGGQKLAYDGSYTYTLTKVTQDTTVSISLPKYGHYTVTPSVDTTLARIEVKPIDAAMKAGTTGYAYGTELELTAIPTKGVRFYSWWDGNTENPRLYRVRSNRKISANFRGTPTDLDNVAKVIDIRSTGNNLYIQTDTECQARIIDMQGRMIDQFSVSGFTTYRINQPGVYIVLLYKGNESVLKKKIKISQ